MISRWLLSVCRKDEIELPAHAMGQRFSRGIQEERDRELALREFNGWVEHWPLIASGEGSGEMVVAEDEGV